MKYSVIIPHKNIPDLLHRCLKSIPQRNDLEVIVVDDHSDENVVSSLYYIKEEYNNWHFIFDTKGGGAGYARNLGLKIAKGDWLIFADADDFFDKFFWDSVDVEIGGGEYDIIYFKSKGIAVDSFEPSSRGFAANKLVNDFISKNNHGEERLRYGHIVPWAKIIRRELVTQNNITFEEIPYCNDILFGTKIGDKAISIDARDKLMYYVTLRDESLSRIKSSDSVRRRYLARLQQHQYMVSVGKTQYAMDVLLYSIKYVLPYSLKDWLWCLKALVKYKVNPLSGLYKIPQYMKSKNKSAYGD